MGENRKWYRKGEVCNMRDGERISVKSMIRKALLELMSEKAYLDITVTDIIKKAEVARVSFYRNYTGIDEVLDSIVDEKVNEMENRIRPLLAYGNEEEQLRVFLRMALESKLSMNENITFITATNKPYIHAKIDERIQEKFARASGESIEEKYIWAIRLGIVTTASNIWLKSGAKESPEQMVEFIMGILHKIK